MPEQSRSGAPMEWTTVQHLDLRHSGGRRGASARPMQPHAAAFRSSQAIVAVAIGTHVVEFDALTGSKIASIDLGARVVRMAYSPTTSHVVIAILEDATIRSCDFATEQTLVLHSPEKKSEHVSIDTEVHLALTPLEPIVFFGFHKRMSVTVVGTVDGGRPPTKIKTDLKKPIVNLACHPRLPVLYVAYAEGLIRAYNIQTYAVHYTLQLAVDSTIKLMGAGAFGFHPTLEWIFVGDRGGTLLAWDVSTERPSMIGITQAGSQPITSVSWLPTLRLLVTISKDGALQVWKTRVIINPNRQPMETHFFERAAIETMDITKILTLQGGEAVYPLPRIKNLAVHPKFNLAAVIFVDMSGTEAAKNKAAYTREGRRQLFALLQGARGSTAAVLKEKLLALGSSGILAEHQLQAQLQEQHLKGQSQLTISDVARKAFLHSHFMEGHAKSGPISRLPLVTISDSSDLLRDVPVCQPFHLELNFFNKETRVVQYPVRAFYMDGFNLMAHNLASGADNLYKKLYSTIPSNVECHPKNMSYSPKQHLFLVVFELSGTAGVAHEVVLYWEQTDLQTVNSKGSSIRGRDAAFLGPDDNQYAILEEDRTSLSLFSLKAVATKEALENNAAVLEENTFADNAANSTERQGPLQFTFESEVDRIFSSPLESTLLYVISGKHIGLAKLLQGYRLSTDNGLSITTKTDGSLPPCSVLLVFSKSLATMARLLLPLPFAAAAAASASSLHLAASRLRLPAVSVARRECLYGGRVVGGVVRAPARLGKRGLCAGAEAGGSAGTVVGQEEALEWVKKDRRRLLHVVYRVGDLDKTIKFYTECLGMKLLRKRDIPEERYTNAFLGYGPEDSHFVVELTYNYGVESYDIGTAFGHFGIAVDDVAKTVELIKAKGGTVTREPGPVKGGKSVIAFIEDPDGYKFELIERGPTPEPLCQVMLRVGDLDRAINFYEKAFGMELLRKRDNPEYKYTIAMMGYGPEDKNAVLELTYNYGLKEYDKGNAYAQIAISTDDVYKTAEAIRVNGGRITREPGPLPGINTKITACTDPDGWKTVFVDNIDFLKELEE